MTEKPFFIVSDTHLGAVPESTEREFRRFLAEQASTGSGLLINGDLFDFWFEYRTVVPARHVRVLAALTDLVEGGVPVWFVGGNHDAWGGSFLESEVGAKLIEGPLVMNLGGRTALVAHGDGVGEGDLGYRILKRVIRHPLTVGAFRMIHPDWGSWIANRVSSTEAKADPTDTSAAFRAVPIREWATRELVARPDIDLVVAGHAHVPEILEVEPGRYYVNSGDWVRNRSYVELPAEGGAPLLRTWSSA